MLKIGVFIDPESTPKAGGAHTYISAIVNELDNNRKYSNRYEIVFVYESSKDVLLNSNKYLNISSYAEKNRFNKLIGKFIRCFNRFFSKPQVNITNSDLLNILIKENQIDFMYFTCPVYFRNIVCPYVFTLWDLAHRSITVFPEVSRDKLQYDSREETYSYMLARASYILTGNEAGADEIKYYYACSKNKIRAIEFFTPSFALNAKREANPNEIYKKFNFSGKYIFYPAQFWSHKNHIIILKALKVLKEKYKKEINVVFSGSDQGNKKYIQQKIIEYGLERQVLLVGFVSEAELIDLYSNAWVMVYASLLGPNNLPPFEAMSLNCPVLLSDIPGHRVQCKDFVWYFNPKSEQDLVDQLIYIENNPEQISSKKECAYNFSQRNTVEVYMDKVFEVFDELKRDMSCWVED